MRTRIAIVSMLVLMAGGCADPDTRPGDTNEKISGYKPDDGNVCDQNKLRLDTVVVGALTHDPAVTKVGGRINEVDQQHWSALFGDSDGSFSCESDVAIRFSNAAAMGGVVRVTYADQSAMSANPGQPANIQFKPDDAILQKVLSEQEATRERRAQEDIASGLTPMRAAEFDLNKHQLPANEKILISGYYWRYLGKEVITDQPPSRIVDDDEPKVALVTDDAPSDAKNSMQFCQRYPGGWCQVTLVGHADTCGYILAAAPASTRVCLYVDGLRKLSPSQSPSM